MSGITIPYIPLSQFSERLSMERLRNDVSSLQTRVSKLKPPQEFFDIRRLSKPADFGEVQSRVGYNLGYYQANYILIVSALSIYALVTNLLLLFLIVFAVLGLLGISRLGGEDLVLPIGRFPPSQLYMGLGIVSLVLGILASPISTLMWLIGSLSVCVFTHAAFMEKPIETVFEEEV